MGLLPQWQPGSGSSDHPRAGSRRANIGKCPPPRRQNLGPSFHISRCQPQLHEGEAMRGPSLILFLVPALFGSLPTWPYSYDWGYLPCAVLALVLVVTHLLVLADQNEQS